VIVIPVNGGMDPKIFSCIVTRWVEHVEVELRCSFMISFDSLSLGSNPISSSMNHEESMIYEYREAYLDLLSWALSVVYFLHYHNLPITFRSTT
jgi:hypothetical protein